MKRSDTKIFTTHVGSLPFLALDKGVGRGRRVASRGRRGGRSSRGSATIGIDIINEGEYAKGGDWLRYMQNRFGGFTRGRRAGGKPLIEQGKDREEFADFYRYADRARHAVLCAGRARSPRRARFRPAPARSPIAARPSSKREIDVHASRSPAPRMYSSPRPRRRASKSIGATISTRARRNIVFALAEAMRVEYEAIVDAGLILQVDDAWLPALWDRIGIGMGLAAFRERCEMRIEALNHALRNIPEDRIRYHLCWGSWHGPHAYDLELDEIVDLMLKVQSAGLSDRRPPMRGTSTKSRSGTT